MKETDGEFHGHALDGLRKQGDGRWMIVKDFGVE
jgi:hypothetical protein